MLTSLQKNHISRVAALYEPGILQQPLAAPFHLDDGKVCQEPWLDSTEPALRARRKGTSSRVHPHRLLQGKAFVRQEGLSHTAATAAAAVAAAAFGIVGDTANAAIAWLLLRVSGVPEGERSRWRRGAVRPEHCVVHASKRVVGLSSARWGRQAGRQEAEEEEALQDKGGAETGVKSPVLLSTVS